MWLLGQALRDTLELVIPALGLTLVCLSIIMLFRKRRLRQKQQGPSVTPREQLERLTQQHAVRGDLESLMVEIEQLSRRLAAQLDNKSAKLEHLLREAEQRIEQLQQLQQQRDDPYAFHDAPEARKTKAAESQQASDNLWQEKPSNAAKGEQASPQDPADELARQVCALADQGHGPVEIASKLGEHIGKIELILALRKAT